MRHKQKQRFGATLDKVQRASEPFTVPNSQHAVDGVLMWMDEMIGREPDPIARLTQSLMTKLDDIRQKEAAEHRAAEQRSRLDRQYGRGAW
jgi:hypothetical protein